MKPSHARGSCVRIDVTMQLASEMAPTFLHGDRPFDLRAFSCVGADPAINQRVVNETAAIVQDLDAPG